MSANNQFPGFSSESASSSPYADVEDVERWSRIRVLPNNKTSSAGSLISRGRNSSSRVIVLAVISLIISTISLVCLGIFCGWVFIYNKGTVFPESARQENDNIEDCRPCLQVSPNPLDSSTSDLWERLEVRNVGETETKNCCADNAAQYAALFKLVLRRQEEIKNLADTLNEAEENGSAHADADPNVNVSSHGTSAVSAHLVYKPSDAPTTTDREEQWKSPSESPLSHVHGDGVQFLNNRIFVKTPGYYFVYCQVLYSSYADSGDDPVVSGYVGRYSIVQPAASGFLLKLRHTRYDVTQDRHSGYVGGVFRLNRGDQLYVRVSRPELVSHDDMASFFGLFRIGG